MSIETTSTEEREDLKRRTELQAKLQEMIRRSASQSELRDTQQQIEKLNKKIEAYATRVKR